MTTQLSVIVPVSEKRFDNIKELYTEYAEALDTLDMSYDFTYVIDGHYPEVSKALDELVESGCPIQVIQLARYFGEANAIMIGHSHSTGDLLLTLPPYRQVEAEEIPRIVNELKEEDVVVCQRWPRSDPKANQLQARIFHWAFNKFSDIEINDLGCGVRVFRRKVLDEIQLYGDQHRFFGLLAYRQGFKVREIKARQSKHEQYKRIYSPGVYLRRLLDLLTVIFLTKFTKKPLRFFGMIGAITFVLGLLVTLILMVEKFFFGVALSDRPALLISTLFMVLGIQITAIGILGEIIIFTHARKLKEYTIDKIVSKR
ncbi:MAG: glycosyltransferase [Gammaproteobacteria bacterium]|nr:glycosyltransferase [Gammaproteobacteria bacterium]